jgi:3-deoxy-D-manno-octulosonic-acid transferase
MIQRVVRGLYTSILVCLLPLMLLRLQWKARGNPAYKARVNERLFWRMGTITPVDVWLHAVSLGEVVAATPLIEHFLAQGLRILVTTMTPTGSQQVLRRFEGRVAHTYIPYDLPWLLRRFFAAFRPRLGIIMETELWPNLITTAAQAHIPLFLANARVSDKAYKQYQYVAWFFATILPYFRIIMAQSELDAERLIAMGAIPERVEVLGNMKFDLTVTTTPVPEIIQLQQAWGSARPVLIAASTHAGEEQALLAAWPRLQQAIPNILLLIVPRHPERFTAVYDLAQTHGFKTAKRSEWAGITQETEVLIVDSMGELLAFYALSDDAFVGGSLVPIGGHNVLEPIALDVPVYCGPFMQNSQSIIDQLQAAHAIQSVANAEALCEAIISLHQNPALRTQQVANARALWLANQGAVLRHVECMNTN